MTDETKIGAIVRDALRSKKFEGEDRRGPQPMGVSDYIKFLPVIALTFGVYGAFVSLQKDAASMSNEIKRLEAHVGKAFDEQKEMNKELWKVVRDK